MNEPISAEYLLTKIDRDRLPRHIAIIMDGNGRWANSQNLARIEGHRHGAETVRRVAQASRKLGISHLTLYAFSDENWQRPATEVAQLMELLAKFLLQERQEMIQNGIQLRVIGTIDRLPNMVQKILKETLEFTSGSHQMTLNLALSYGARNEIVRAVRRVVEDVQSGELNINKLDADGFSQYLDTNDLPDPDLLIRTSGELRISNFLLWQLAYTELYVTPVLWPEFREVDLYQAILDYQKRERRYGLTSDQLKKSKCS